MLRDMEGVLGRARGSAVRRFVKRARMMDRSAMRAAALTVVEEVVLTDEWCGSWDMKEWFDLVMTRYIYRRY